MGRLGSWMARTSRGGLVTSVSVGVVLAGAVAAVAVAGSGQIPPASVVVEHAAGPGSDVEAAADGDVGEPAPPVVTPVAAVEERPGGWRNTVEEHERLKHRDLRPKPAPADVDGDRSTTRERDGGKDTDGATDHDKDGGHHDTDGGKDTEGGAPEDKDRDAAVWPPSVAVHLFACVAGEDRTGTARWDVKIHGHPVEVVDPGAHLVETRELGADKVLLRYEGPVGPHPDREDKVGVAVTVRVRSVADPSLEATLQAGAWLSAHDCAPG